ncbi:MAG: 2-oxoacid:acceptor oxidoreductase family protein, partial [Treponema sp.]|nr:2-oxoacid:acceptor oxidoreductase family protein [Treponema sp.]
NFTIGINDDVTRLSLPQKAEVDISPAGTVGCKLWGLGSDGTVGANKNTVKIVGEHTQLYTQAYFVYDSKKSGGLTQSHLRFGKEPIRSPYLVSTADFVACHNPSYVTQYDLLKDLKKGGVFLLNCQWNAGELENKLPDSMKKAVGEKQVQFYIINAIDIAKELGLGGRTNAILQAAFFKLVNLIPSEDAVKYMKDAIRKTCGKKGKDIVEMNHAAVDRVIGSLVRVDVPESWAEITVAAADKKAVPEFIEKIVTVMNRQEGDSIPVSAFVGMEDGTFPAGTSMYEKRGAAVEVPQWVIEDCIQCNQCAYVCPHAAIRPVLLDKKEREAAPNGFESKKALVMRPLDTQRKEAKNWDYAMEAVSVKQDVDKEKSVKNSQFAQPLFEFSGACAGCAETPYIKLITRLFGDRMYIANASGCSTAYGGSTPSTPYTKNKEGCGPAWAMSLFEDCAEYAYGMLLGSEKIRERIKKYAEYFSQKNIFKAEAERRIETMEDSKNSRKASESFESALRQYTAQSSEEEKEMIGFLLENKDFFPAKSYRAFGGDGWAYDIGYGGLDHVLSLGKNINVLVMDTEVYSNTGGQSSKSTAAGAIAKFNASGKNKEKGFGHDGHELRLYLRCSGGNGV